MTSPVGALHAAQADATFLLHDVSHSLPPEYLAICQAVAIGFAVMGFLGYFVKLVSRLAVIVCLDVHAGG